MDITVAYNKNYLNDGEQSDTPTILTYSENNAIIEEGPERNNYIFLCWNTNSNNTGTVYYPGNTISQDLTLYAIWEPVCYLTSEATLTSIANTIRANNGKSTLYSFPEGFINGIENIENPLFFSYVNGTLISINLSNVFNITPYAFAFCSELTTVNFPDCTSIERYGFANCSSLTSVNFPVCTIIGNDAFNECYNLTSISFPSCTTIEVNAFNQCYNLTSISFPACTTIKDYAFQFCSSLFLISLPACTTIMSYAFYNCSNLTSIYLNNSSVCYLRNDDAFYSTKITRSTGSIYVPASLLTEYQSALYWSYFSARFFPIT